MSTTEQSVIRPFYTDHEIHWNNRPICNKYV